MSDLMCLACGCGPHRQAPCAKCGCTTWVNAALAAFRSNCQLQQTFEKFYSQHVSMMIDLLELLTEVFPEATQRVDAKREEMRKKLEEQAASQQQGSAPDQGEQNSEQN